ncbi:hypothetical protein KFZ56_10860 [Virgibacillus sp. NKC19-3]|uniref:YqfQ family protein n=1 Tax=Virgibacillus saliphilus TaxID=2831674 RepID=UPI001C9B112F|nr:YqfQ family protein [Virgibacillus sp. NKC19-3]MBY7143537.1 hypothetical protein [Virgibacillus sp. NKC19-3]
MVFPVQQPKNSFPNHRPYAVNNSLLPTQRLNAPKNRNSIKSFFQNQSTGELVNKGIGGLSGVLNNVQQVLNVVQSTTPIVQEYGPMVKNIPAMYRMMKAIKEVDHPDDVDHTDDNVDEKQNHSDKKEDTVSNNNNSKAKKDNGLSTPKLFI